MLGFYTVRQGERVAVWGRQGEVRLVDGPRRLFLLGETVQPLERFAAGVDEYLVITYTTGRVEHVRGPADAWIDPIRHEDIRVEPAFAIDGNEAVVVYRQENGQVSRRVVRGPDQFVPMANEWLHEFCWHGSDPRNPRHKTYGALRFKKLRVIPDQMYFDVQDVRTADDALLVVKVMVFFELVDIERMLDQTHDPIADFINALTADVMDFAAVRPFETFKEQTERLNDLATYPQLTQRGERIGYRITKVVYRGYEASPALQLMHDQAIEARTRLRLEAETQEQAQELADMRLAREIGRAQERQAMEEGEVRHKAHLRALEHEEVLRQREAEQQRDAAGRRLINGVEEEHQRATNAEQTAFLQAMQGMSVDLTRYLVAQYQNPDRLIRIEDGTGAELHLHE